MKIQNRRLLLPYVSGLVACGILIWASPATAQNSCGDLGSFEKWEKVEVTRSGSESVGRGDSNSFGIAVDGVFTVPSGKSYVVPGFYAGDAVLYFRHE